MKEEPSPGSISRPILKKDQPGEADRLLDLWGSTAFRPILARFNGDITGAMMTGLRTGALGKAIDLDRDDLVAARWRLDQRKRWQMVDLGSFHNGEWRLDVGRVHLTAGAGSMCEVRQEGAVSHQKID